MKFRRVTQCVLLSVVSPIAAMCVLFALMQPSGSFQRTAAVTTHRGALYDPFVIASIATVRSRALTTGNVSDPSTLLARTVASLGRNTRVPNAILVHITADFSGAEARSIHDVLSRLVPRSTAVHIVRRPAFWYSSAKFFGALRWWWGWMSTRQQSSNNVSSLPPWPGTSVIRRQVTHRSDDAAQKSFILTVDDDMDFATDFVLTRLLAWRPTTAVGSSGWRHQRGPFPWGTRPWCIDFYRVNCEYLVAPVEVTVLNSGAGILFRPFDVVAHVNALLNRSYADELLDAGLSDDASQAVVRLVPPYSRLMDDVLACACLHSAGLRKLVVPAPTHGTHLGADISAVDVHLSGGFADRASLNHETLKSFPWPSLDHANQTAPFWWGMDVQPPHLRWSRWLLLMGERLIAKFRPSESFSTC